MRGLEAVRTAGQSTAAQQSISTAALDLTFSMIETGEIRMEYSHRVGDGVRGVCVLSRNAYSAFTPAPQAENSRSSPLRPSSLQRPARLIASGPSLRLLHFRLLLGASCFEDFGSFPGIRFLKGFSQFLGVLPLLFDPRRKFSRRCRLGLLPRHCSVPFLLHALPERLLQYARLLQELLFLRAFRVRGLLKRGPDLFDLCQPFLLQCLSNLHDRLGGFHCIRTARVGLGQGKFASDCF
jgi:hypothetical protein